MMMLMIINDAIMFWWHPVPQSLKRSSNLNQNKLYIRHNINIFFDFAVFRKLFLKCVFYPCKQASPSKGVTTKLLSMPHARPSYASLLLLVAAGVWLVFLFFFCQAHFFLGFCCCTSPPSACAPWSPPSSTEGFVVTGAAAATAGSAAAAADALTADPALEDVVVVVGGLGVESWEKATAATLAFAAAVKESRKHTKA